MTPATVTTVSPDDVTAICAAMGVVAAVFLFSVNAIIGRHISNAMDRIEIRFATRDHVKTLESRLDLIESGRRVHRFKEGD